MFFWIGILGFGFVVIWIVLLLVVFVVDEYFFVFVLIVVVVMLVVGGGIFLFSLELDYLMGCVYFGLYLVYCVGL